MTGHTKRTKTVKLTGVVPLKINAITSGSLLDSGSTDINCDAYITVEGEDGNTYYLALYDTTA